MVASAAEFKNQELLGISKLDFLFQACVLRDIEIQGTRAVAHKKFDGSAQTTEGVPIRLLWQTLYFLKKVAGAWKITGFVGYLPNSMP